MITTFWFTVTQAVVLLAVYGFAWWASRLIAEAANSSAVAARQAGKAVDDAERTATDIREMRAALQRSLDQQQALAEELLELARQAQVGRLGGQGRTDTAEVHALITPQAITARGNGVNDPARNSLEDPSASTRHRDASDTDSRWTSALRAIASRTASRVKSQEA